MNMKLGIGLYRHMLTPEYFQFARQCGCTHLIVHLATYYDKQVVTATDENSNYGAATAKDPIWELDNLLALKKQAAEYGLDMRTSILPTGTMFFSQARSAMSSLKGSSASLKTPARLESKPSVIISVWPGSGGTRKSMLRAAVRRAPALTLRCSTSTHPSRTARFGI